MHFVQKRSRERMGRELSAGSVPSRSARLGIAKALARTGCRFPFKLSLLFLQLAPLTLASCHQPSALPVSGKGGIDLLLCRELEDGLARRRRNSFARTAQADLPHHFFLLGRHLGEIDVSDDVGNQMLETGIDAVCARAGAARACQQ